MLKRKVLALSCFLLALPLVIVLEFLLASRLIGLSKNGQLSAGRKILTPIVEEDKGRSMIAAASPLVAILEQGEPSSGTSATLKSKIIAGDARPILIKNYLDSYHSPLAPFGDVIYETSQRYGLDYRLLVAIAQQESNLCKKIPEGSYNCWGWGIHSRGTLMFSSFPEAIEEVARGLKENYIDMGYVTPEQIMKKYTPLSNGSWAAGVNQFMEEIES